MPLVRLAGDEDKLLVPFDQLAGDVDARFHKFNGAAACQEFVSHRVAMAHSPDRLRTMQQDGSFCILQKCLLDEGTRLPVTNRRRSALKDPQGLFDRVTATLP